MTRRRGRIEPPNGRRKSWLVRLSLGVDSATGRRIRLNKSCPSKREAEQWLTGQLAKVDQGQRPATGALARMTLGEWLQEWEELWSDRLSPRTRENALDSLRLNLTPALRSRPLRSLTAGEVQRRLQELLAAGKSPATVHYFYRVLRARLNEAKVQGRIADNPLVGKVRPPTIPRRDGRTLSQGEARRFLELCGSDRHGALWATLLLTGLRPEEALALRWGDLEGNVLHVRRALVRRKGIKGVTVTTPGGQVRRAHSGELEFRQPKTGRHRSVPLSPLVVKILASHRANQGRDRLQLGAEYRGQDLVFASTFGAPLQWTTTVSRYFRPLIGRLAMQLVGDETPPPRAVKGQREARTDYRARTEAALAKTGLDRLRAYDLRHSAATLMIASGESARAVQEILGHSSVTLTLSTYFHPSAGDLEGAVGRLEDTIRTAAPIRRVR